MNIFMGIDLGSTTTKAVVLDENANILGRGITNSRSNYDTACAIARSEAFIDTRFTMLTDGLKEALGDKSGRLLEAFHTTVTSAFRLEQYLTQLSHLRGIALAEADTARHVDHKGALIARLEALFDALGAEAEQQYMGGSARHSDFFRDLAGSAYMRLASEMAEEDGVTYPMLVNIFDKCIIRVENSVLDLGFESNIGTAMERAFGHHGQMDEVRRQAVRKAAEEVATRSLDVIASVGTGYGRARLPFPKEQIRSEILCHGLGAHAMYPNSATVLDIGGQDTKAIQVNREGIVTSFQMNDRCAAGCGRYLGYIADELNIGVQELGPLAQQATRSVRINSTCTVFAGAELRERLNNGERREDILRGLHRAIILRAMSLLARSGGVEDEFTFTGGVANNPAAVDALRMLVEENYGKRTLNISPDSIYTGALGAGHFAIMSAQGTGPAMEGTV